jgi:hypothetical protein
MPGILEAASHDGDRIQSSANRLAAFFGDDLAVGGRSVKIPRGFACHFRGAAF